MRHCLEGALMHEARVIAVCPVLHLELPVAFIGEGVRPVGPDLAYRRKIGPQVYVWPNRAEMLFEARHLIGQAGEDQAAVGCHARGWEQTRKVAAYALRVALRMGDARQLPAVLVDPTVVVAAKSAGAAALIAAHEVAAMTADVEQYVDVAFVIAADDDRLFANVGGAIVARGGDLALVRHVDPRLFEDPAHLLLEDGRVREQTGVDAEVVGRFADQLRVGGRHVSPAAAACGGAPRTLT